jgi:hypothetical protein
MMNTDDPLSSLEAIINVDNLHPAPISPVPVIEEQERRVALTEALSTLPPAVVLRISTIAARYGIKHDSDPMWALVEAVQDGLECANAAATAATAAGKAARLVHEDVAGIPDTIQKAVVAGGEDVAGQVRTALTSNLGEFAEAIGHGVHLATNKAVTNVQTALKNFDAKVDKTIIARKDAVIAQWVQSGSDALDQRVREAIKTEKTINLVFMLFVIFSTFILGIVLGTQLHLHF